MENKITRQEFLQAVVIAVKQMSEVPANARVTKLSVNNGQRDCVQVEFSRNSYANVGLDGYYQMFCDGDISALMAAAEAVIQAKEDAQVKENDIQDIIQVAINYEQVKGRLMCRLVNTELNRNKLNEVPNIPFHDLSIIFYFTAGSDMCMTTNITNNMTAEWEIDIDELFEDALANMQAKASVQIQSMFEILSDMEGVPVDDMERAAETTDVPTLYVLTNKAKCIGAAVVLYPGILESCAEMMGGDYYLIPSSIHEFLIAPVSAGEPDEIQTMIRDINQRALVPEEVLADHAYLYSAAKKRLQSYSCIAGWIK